VAHAPVHPKRKLKQLAKSSWPCHGCHGVEISTSLSFLQATDVVRGKTGVTADRDKIEFRLFNSSSIFNITLNSILSRSAVTPVFPVRRDIECQEHKMPRT